MNSYGRKLFLIAILNIFGLSQNTTYIQKSFTKDYCDPALCPKYKHIACNAHPAQFSGKCSLDAYVVPMTKELSSFLLTHFNYMRNKVAGGQLSPFPTASRMSAFKWNDELSYLAEVNVRQCDLLRDKCRNTDDFPDVGQTVAFLGVFAKQHTLYEILLRQMGNWFNEQKVTPLRQIMKHTRKNILTKNFFQVVVENADTVGCAILQQSKNIWLTTYLTCNYNKAPLVGQYIYTVGRPASQCETVDPDYKNLCALKTDRENKIEEEEQKPIIKQRTNKTEPEDTKKQDDKLDNIKEKLRAKYEIITADEVTQKSRMLEVSEESTQSPESRRIELNSRFERFTGVLKKAIGAIGNITITTSNQEVEVDANGNILSDGDVEDDSHQFANRRMLRYKHK